MIAMKRFSSKPLHPLIIILFCALLGLVVVFVVDDVDRGIEMFLGLIGTGISAAVVQTAIIQNAIQKDNIKLQLFDKRYQVLQPILDSITLVRRDNWDRYVMLGAETDPNFVSHQIIETEERLFQATQLSTALFDSELTSKIEKVNNAFCLVARSYKNMLMTNIQIMQNKELFDKFMLITSKHFAAPQVLNYDNLDTELKAETPELYIPLKEFSDECEKYIELIADLKILGDFNQYVIIRDLDS